MSISFEPRPDWVRAANAGEIPVIADEAALPFSRDLLLDTARAQLGLDRSSPDDFGSDEFLEPLDVFLRAIETEAELHRLGRWMTRRFLLRLLRGRLQLQRYVREDPGVLDEEIREPLFVVGAPRTGTTVLHGLLAQDPALRAPEGWELLLPVPPPRAETFADDPRIAIAAGELSLPQTVTSKLEAIHRYSGRMYKECLSAMSFAFRSEEFISRYHVPSYARWFATCDRTPAYEIHRLVLQVLQRRMPGRTWVLKSPVHLHSLDVLERVYPDARLIVTHRDPLAVLGSVSSLIATLRWAHSDEVDTDEIGRYHVGLYAGALDGLARRDGAGGFATRRIAHCRFADLSSDPLATVRRLYADFGLALPDDAVASMGARADANPRGQHGEHRYTLGDFGIDPAEAADALARYGAHFDISIGDPT